MRTAMAWDTQESRAGDQLGVVTVGGSKTGKATPTGANEAGAGCRHGARIAEKERVSGW